MENIEEVTKMMAFAEQLKGRMMPKAIIQTEVVNGLVVSKTIEQQTYAVPEAISISIDGLYGLCDNNHEWILIGKILKELHLNNCLWYCGPEFKKQSGVIPKALKGLIDKGMLWKTNTPHYYLVNPKYMRKGNLIFTLITTSKAIWDNKGIDQSLLRPLQTVKQFYFSGGGYEADMNGMGIE